MNSTGISTGQIDRKSRGHSNSAALACLMFSVMMTPAACSSMAELPEADLESPGWTVWTGQALWKPATEQAALAGDMIVGQRAGGDIFVSFTKTPLPLFTARAVDSGWRIDFVERGRSYSGRGSPPQRFIWFRIPEILDGNTNISGWSIEKPAADEIVLTNARTGERVQMIVDP